jgi:formylglycine-generating enzyme required for sulfatase activity
LQDIYRTNADAGLHAATEWLLRQWKQEAWLKRVNEEWANNKELREERLEGIKQVLAKDKEKTPPQWYVNGQGQTMVVLPGPVTFLMGSPPTEAGRFDAETQHKKWIGRTFALAAKAVTVEQYRRFDKNYQLPAVFTRTADLPVVGTSWYQATAYCNWLSKEEGIDESQWCYEIKDGQVAGLKANYLSLTGYRLPTEAETEYATRAGALTSRYYGETEDLLPKYAWYSKNSQEKTWPVGSLKPNDFGLFDMQGNAHTWCQERFMDYPSKQGKELEDKEDIFSIDNQDNHVLRGGSFDVPVSVVRSSFRGYGAPAVRILTFGFRPARTFTP